MKLRVLEILWGSVPRFKNIMKPVMPMNASNWSGNMQNMWLRAIMIIMPFGNFHLLFLVLICLKIGTVCHFSSVLQLQVMGCGYMKRMNFQHC